MHLYSSVDNSYKHTTYSWQFQYKITGYRVGFWDNMLQETEMQKSRTLAVYIKFFITLVAYQLESKLFYMLPFW